MTYFKMLTLSMCASVAILISFSTAQASDADLAKESQNPLGTVISLPFENNLNFGIGPSSATAYVLNIKPVYPAKIGTFNLINRFILPAIYTEGQDVPPPPDASIDVGYGGVMDLAQGSAFGLGDLTYQGYFSPSKPGNWTWGIGPVLVAPTATENRYASDKWSAGPGAVALTKPGRWLVGALIQNVWSFAGDSESADVNQFLFQYFLNYNLDNGLYLTSGPVITANWEADSDDRWTVPLGGGLGRLVKHGNQPVDYKLVAYYNVEKPQFGSDWSLQFTVKFLFPK